MAIPSGELWKTWPYRKFDDLPINSMVIFHIYAGWWFGTWLDYDFPHIGNVIIVIIPTDELTHSMIFQRGRSTTNQVVDGQLTANPRNPWWISMDFMGPTSTLWSLWRGPKKPMRSEFGVQSHGGSPQKHASHGFSMDFPWIFHEINHPAVGVAPWLWKPPYRTNDRRGTQGHPGLPVFDAQDLRYAQRADLGSALAKTGRFFGHQNIGRGFRSKQGPMLFCGYFWLLEMPSKTINKS